MPEGHGGVRKNSGRKKGSGLKIEKVLGYKYTLEEAEYIRNTLEELKEKYGTISKAILELCNSYNEKNDTLKLILR